MFILLSDIVIVCNRLPALLKYWMKMYNDTITDNNPSIHLPSIMLQIVSSNQCCKYPYFSDVLHYTWHRLQFCPSWERDPSLWGFYVFVKVFPYSSWGGRGCHTLLKPYETDCDLWIWAIQIKFDWLIWLIDQTQLVLSSNWKQRPLPFKVKVFAFWAALATASK